MAEAERPNTPETPAEPTLEADACWLSIDDEFEQRLKWLRYGEIAIAALQKDLEDGSLPCMGRSADGRKEIIPLETWRDQYALDLASSGVRVVHRHERKPGGYVIHLVRGWRFYVWRPPGAEVEVDALGVEIEEAEPVKAARAEAAEAAAQPEAEAKRKPEQSKSYWDASVRRVLDEKFPGETATDFEAKHVVDTVLDALASEIKEAGRKPPTRGLICRRSGHWKS
jgi:hypothetical protein